jgi:integrase
LERFVTLPELQDFMAELKVHGKIGAGTTLHGLRVSYAAWWKRTGGASNSEVADLVGDESQSTGMHDTPHVDSENNINRAFSRVKQAVNADLQSAKE